MMDTTTASTLTTAHRNGLRAVRIRGAATSRRPPLPIQPESDPVVRSVTGVPPLERVVRIPWRPQSNGAAIAVRKLDAGRLTWDQVAGRLGWHPGTGLAVSVERHWLHLSPTEPDTAATFVDDRGRVVVDVRLRLRLGVDSGGQVVARIPATGGRLELCSFAVVAVALDAVDEAGLHLAAPTVTPTHEPVINLREVNHV